jgi:hypothetical protein
MRAAASTSHETISHGVTGERLLIAELLRISFKDLAEPRARRDALRWFESGTGLFTLHDVACYLELDAETLRRAAERTCYRNGSEYSLRVLGKDPSGRVSRHLDQ